MQSGPSLQREMGCGWERDAGFTSISRESSEKLPRESTREASYSAPTTRAVDRSGVQLWAMVCYASRWTINSARSLHGWMLSRDCLRKECSPFFQDARQTELK